jgi:hypothetical protein
MRSILALWILFLSGIQAFAASPNVIVIFVDDMGYADIGPFGAKLTTPNFDRMAKEGRKLSNFHVSSAVCSASRAALLTGCYHNRVGIHGALGPKSKVGLNPAEITIAPERPHQRTARSPTEQCPPAYTPRQDRPSRERLGWTCKP